MHFPLSPFVLSVLQLLDIAPSQLTGVAWCHINSFESFLHSLAVRSQCSPETMRPTVGLFLEYYRFIRSDSWVSTRKRSGNPFDVISKVNLWQKGFYFLPSSSATDALLAGVRREWNFKVILPGRRALKSYEANIRLRIGALCSGLYSSFFHYVYSL